MLGEGEKSSFHFYGPCFFHLVYSLSARVILCFSIYFFLRSRVELVGSVSGKVRALKKPGGGKKTNLVFEVFFLKDFIIKICVVNTDSASYL